MCKRQLFLSLIRTLLGWRWISKSGCKWRRIARDNLYCYSLPMYFLFCACVGFVCLLMCWLVPSHCVLYCHLCLFTFSYSTLLDSRQKRISHYESSKDRIENAEDSAVKQCSVENSSRIYSASTTFSATPGSTPTSRQQNRPKGVCCRLIVGISAIFRESCPFSD